MHAPVSVPVWAYSIMLNTFIIPKQLHSDPADLQRAAAMWMLKVKEKNKLSQMALQGIIEDVTNLIQTYLRDLNLSIKNHLKEGGVSEEVISSLDPFFSPGGKYGEPFRGLETEHRQLKYFKNCFSMVVRSEPKTFCV